MQAYISIAIPQYCNVIKNTNIAYNDPFNGISNAERSKRKCTSRLNASPIKSMEQRARYSMRVDILEATDDV